MLRLFKTFFIYIFPTILIIAGIEAGLGSMNNSYTEKKKLLEQHLSTAEILIMGNSLAYRGINPAFITPPSFNLAYISQSFFYDRALITRYTPQMPKLKIVIITNSYFSMEFDLSHSPEYWRCFFYERFMKMPLESNAHALDIQRFSLMKLYGRANTLKYMHKLFQMNLAENMNTDGGSPFGLDKIEPAIAGINARISFHNSIMEPERIPANTAHLRFILRFLKQRHIQPVFVTMPVSTLYAQNMDPRKYTASQEIIRTLSGQEQVPYYNYTSDKRFTQEDFQDGDHLSNTGSRKFTTILDKEVIEPLLKR